MSAPETLSAFRLGDIRGVYPEDINERFVENFAHAFVGCFNLSGCRVATGRDMRASSESLQATLNTVMAEIGVEVVDIGLCPTELGYFASTTRDIDAAIIVTASHNPARYNGLKCVLKNGRPITEADGLGQIKTLMLEQYRHGVYSHGVYSHGVYSHGVYSHGVKRGRIVREDFHDRYLAFLKKNFNPEVLRHGVIALNGLNGTAATMADMLASEFGIPVNWYRKQPGPMPEAGADPANPRLAREMKNFMAAQSYVLGVAWDGDCDRCVCFDEAGDLVPAYYLIGLLIEKFLTDKPGGAIVFDTKLCWNTLDLIQSLGGVPVRAETGHAFMKQKMHDSKAIYGGELSSHHYFGAFSGCDSGMFSWLTVLGILSERDLSIREMISERKARYAITPESSVALTDPDAAMTRLMEVFGNDAHAVEQFDGLAFSMPGDWRFSVKRSKTEPVVRINFEMKRQGQADSLLERGQAVFNVLAPFRADEQDWLENFYLL